MIQLVATESVPTPPTTTPSARRSWLVLLGVAVGYLLFGAFALRGVLLEPGFLLGGDWIPYWSGDSARAVLDEAFSSWSHIGTVFGAPSSHVNHYSALVGMAVAGTIGIDGDTFQRLVLLFFFTFNGCSFFLLLRCLGVRSVGAALGGFFFVANPVFFNYVIMGWIFVLLALGLLPIALILFIRSVRENRLDLAILNGAVWALAFCQAQVIFWYPIAHLCFLPLALRAKTPWRSIARVGAVQGLVFIGLHAFWLLPLLQAPAGVGGATSDYDQNRFSGLLGSYNLLRNWGSLFNSHFEISMTRFSVALSYLPALIAFSILLVRRPRRREYCFIALALTVPLIVALRGQIAQLPFSVIIRDVSRHLTLGVFAAAGLVALAVEHWSGAAGGRRARFVALGVALALTLSAWPYFGGELTNVGESNFGNSYEGRDQRVRLEKLPDAWLAAERVRRDDATPYKSLWAPTGGGLGTSYRRDFRGAFAEFSDVASVWSTGVHEVTLSDKASGASADWGRHLVAALHGDRSQTPSTLFAAAGIDEVLLRPGHYFVQEHPAAQIRRVLDADPGLLGSETLAPELARYAVRQPQPFLRAGAPWVTGGGGLGAGGVIRALGIEPVASGRVLLLEAAQPLPQLEDPRAAATPRSLLQLRPWLERWRERLLVVDSIDAFVVELLSPTRAPWHEEGRWWLDEPHGGRVELWAFTARHQEPLALRITAASPPWKTPYCDSYAWLPAGRWTRVATVDLEPGRYLVEGADFHKTSLLAIPADLRSELAQSLTELEPRVLALPSTPLPAPAAEALSLDIVAMPVPDAAPVAEELTRRRELQRVATRLAEVRAARASEAAAEGETPESGVLEVAVEESLATLMGALRTGSYREAARLLREQSGEDFYLERALRSHVESDRPALIGMALGRWHHWYSQRHLRRAESDWVDVPHAGRYRVEVTVAPQLWQRAVDTPLQPTTSAASEEITSAEIKPGSQPPLELITDGSAYEVALAAPLPLREGHTLRLRWRSEAPAGDLRADIAAVAELDSDGDGRADVRLLPAGEIYCHDTLRHELHHPWDISPASACGEPNAEGLTLDLRAGAEATLRRSLRAPLARYSRLRLRARGDLSRVEGELRALLDDGRSISATAARSRNSAGESAITFDLDPSQLTDANADVVRLELSLRSRGGAWLLIDSISWQEPEPNATLAIAAGSAPLLELRYARAGHWTDDAREEEIAFDEALGLAGIDGAIESYALVAVTLLARGAEPQSTLTIERLALGDRALLPTALIDEAVALPIPAVSGNDDGGALAPALAPLAQKSPPLLAIGAHVFGVEELRFLDEELDGSFDRLATEGGHLLLEEVELAAGRQRWRSLLPERLPVRALLLEPLSEPQSETATEAPTESATARIDQTQRAGTDASAEVSAFSGALIFWGESLHTGWHATLAEAPLLGPFRTHGFGNGYLVEETAAGTLEIDYAPQAGLELGWVITLIVWGITLAAFALAARRRWRRGSSAPLERSLPPSPDTARSALLELQARSLGAVAWLWILAAAIACEIYRAAVPGFTGRPLFWLLAGSCVLHVWAAAARSHPRPAPVPSSSDDDRAGS